MGEKAAMIVKHDNEWNANSIDSKLSPHFADVQSKLKNLINYYCTDYCKGAYALYGNDQWFQVRPILQDPILNTHFCDEHLADWQGFMEGAINTGEAVAETI